CQRQGFFRGFSHPKLRIWNIVFFQKCGKTTSIFCQIQRFVCGPDYVYTVSIQLFSQLQSCLSAQLNDYAFGFFVTDYVVNMFPKNGFKIKFIRNVKICGNGFRVTIYHYGFVTTFGSGQYPVNTTIIKLDALPYSVWA